MNLLSPKWLYLAIQWPEPCYHFKDGNPLTHHPSTNFSLPYQSARHFTSFMRFAKNLPTWKSHLHVLDHPGHHPELHWPQTPWRHSPGRHAVNPPVGVAGSHFNPKILWVMVNYEGKTVIYVGKPYIWENCLLVTYRLYMNHPPGYGQNELLRYNKLPMQSAIQGDVTRHRYNYTFRHEFYQQNMAMCTTSTPGPQEMHGYISLQKKQPGIKLKVLQTNMGLGTLDCKSKQPVSCTTPWAAVNPASGREPSSLGSKRDFEGAMER